MFNLTSFVRPRTAPVKDQEEQLSDLQQALADARAATAAAQDAFDLAGTPATEKALAKAQEAEQEAARYLARAERNLAAAEAKRAIEERRAKESRAAELQGLLSDRHDEARLVEAEVAAWRSVVSARLERREHNVKRAALERELAVIRQALGDESAVSRLGYEVEPFGHPVAEALEKGLYGERDETRRRYVSSAASAARSFR